MPRPRWSVVVVVCCIVAGGCGRRGAGAPAGDAGDARGAGRLPTGSLVVFAASSLTEPFAALGRAFEADHAGVAVRFNFAASSDLARQIDQGARADVFASADEEAMRTLTATGSAGTAKVVARNRLAILVERGNPKAVDSLADLARPGIVLALCAPEVPCGRLAAAAFRAAGVAPRPSSLEENVKAVVSKVTLGEADAGVVYRSDVIAAGDRAQGVDIGIDGAGLEAVYPMAVTTASANRATAAGWVDFVLSDRAQRVLRAHGFLAP